MNEAPGQVHERPVLFIGIDWADQKHDCYVIDRDGKGSHRAIAHSPEEIDNWVTEMLQLADGKPIAIMLEQSRRALMYALMFRKNVLVTGSGRGGVTNSKGEYSISGITAGVYTVRISLLGYQAMESRKVTINADETAVLNFKLASSDIELEGITVEGRPPIVDVSKTAGDQTFSRDKIEALPDVKGVEDVLALQAGVVRFGGQLFLRGGRANETQILIDGVAVNDGSGAAAVNQDLQQIYAGNASGGVLSVSAAAIQSVSVESGGLDGEFGNAQSGVINVTTKSGTESYSGAVEYRTDALTSQDSR